MAFIGLFGSLSKKYPSRLLNDCLKIVNSLFIKKVILNQIYLYIMRDLFSLADTFKTFIFKENQ